MSNDTHEFVPCGDINSGCSGHCDRCDVYKCGLPKDDPIHQQPSQHEPLEPGWLKTVIENNRKGNQWSSSRQTEPTVKDSLTVQEPVQHGLIELPPLTAEEATKILRGIFDELQNDFHDQWDHMEAKFCLLAIEAENAQLKRELQQREQRIAELEAFMVLVGKAVNCLPSFADPVYGNEHIFKAIEKGTR